jgi:hypothetical protein
MPDISPLEADSYQLPVTLKKEFLVVEKVFDSCRTHNQLINECAENLHNALGNDRFNKLRIWLSKELSNSDKNAATEIIKKGDQKFKEYEDGVSYRVASQAILGVALSVGSRLALVFATTFGISYSFTKYADTQERIQRQNEFRTQLKQKMCIESFSKKIKPILNNDDYDPEYLESLKRLNSSIMNQGISECMQSND